MRGCLSFFCPFLSHIFPFDMLGLFGFLECGQEGSLLCHLGLVGSCDDVECGTLLSL